MPFSHINMPKYSRMIVQGTSIGIDEAFITLLRTSYSWDKSDRIFRMISEQVKKDYKVDLNGMHSLLKDEGFILPVYYLDNYRFTNIGGVLKGICQFDGTVACDFNVGKHSSYEDLVEEWGIIAEACPWLNLTATFFNKGAAEEAGPTYALFSLSVKEGKVKNTNNHLPFTEYVHSNYPQLQHSQLTMLASFLFKNSYGLFTDNFKWAMKSKRFSSFFFK